ncbi:MAG: DUF6599 family protein [Terracidiphilus sp.]
MKRRIGFVVLIAALAGGQFVWSQKGQPSAAEKKAATKLTLPPSPAAVLLDDFDGWIAAEPPKTVNDAATLDPANAAALKEYGLDFGVVANYKREGETLAIRALRFDDGSGAYGAYSYYRQNGWPKESIGAGAASDNNRVLFWRGNTVVDATFSHVGPMSAGELREIADKLPVPGGNKDIAPPVLGYLPQANLEGQTTHYALGPAGYAGSGGVLPPALVRFDLGAETATANYSLASGIATLTVIEYPTPQIAQAQESAIRAYIKAGSAAQPAWPKPLTDSDTASLEVRRSGVLVALVSGDATPDESHRLIELVHFEANLTSMGQPQASEVQKTARLLVGIAGIVIVGSLAAILLGFFLGGGRALYRMARGKPASSVFDEEFIHLDLREEYVEVRKEMVEKPAAIQGPHPRG